MGAVLSRMPISGAGAPEDVVAVAVADAWRGYCFGHGEHGVPLAESPCCRGPDVWSAEIFGRAGVARDVAVEKAVVETGQQCRRQLVACQQTVDLCFPCVFYVWLALDSSGHATTGGAACEPLKSLSKAAKLRYKEIEDVLSRSMRTAVPLPYARSSTASSSIWSSDAPGRFLTALNN